jgi:peptidoglycan/xylan/chitin deacetylase (PgdA/CDA1 family)
MKRVVILAFISAGTLSVLSLLPLHEGSSFGAEIKVAAPAIPWSRLPPTALNLTEVPQFVAVTFDDNFGLAVKGANGVASPIVEFFSSKRNPRSGRKNDFGGTPIATTFFDTSMYMVDGSKKVFGGNRGEDHDGRNLAAWKSALVAGNEIADHTVNHFNGGALRFSKEPCCRARDWSVAQWASEIAACQTALTDPRYGLGATEVIGFRAPYLSYNDNLFTALQQLGFVYDSSVVNCLADEEDGTNCSWPYSLDQGSPDGNALAEKLRRSAPHPLSLPAIGAHAGLFEIPITALIVPPDSVAGKYGFAPGLRSRVDAHAHYLTVYDASKAKIAGVDYNLFIQAGMTGDEMRAVLQYNLDLHLSGNRSPLVFVAHAQLYAFSSRGENFDPPSNADRQARWQALREFITYALSKPEVRIVAATDIVTWMRAASSKRSSTSLIDCRDC